MLPTTKNFLLFFWYVYKEDIREEDFLEVVRMTGWVPGKAIIDCRLRAHDIPAVDMCGQCYDGASNVSGARAGVKAVVQEIAPKAMYYIIISFFFGHASFRRTYLDHTRESSYL